MKVFVFLSPLLVSRTLSILERGIYVYEIYFCNWWSGVVYWEGSLQRALDVCKTVVLKVIYSRNLTTYINIDQGHEPHISTGKYL